MRRGEQQHERDTRHHKPCAKGGRDNRSDARNLQLVAYNCRRGFVLQGLQVQERKRAEAFGPWQADQSKHSPRRHFHTLR